MSLINESEWERLALEVLAESGWATATGAGIAHERASAADLVLPERLAAKAHDLNPQVPETYLRQAVTEILTPKSQDAISENKRLHDYLTQGYRGVSWIDRDGIEQNPTIALIDPDPGRNDWLAAHQVTVRDRDRHRRFDVVLYCNGLPVAILELKQAGQPNADLAKAHAQLGTYLGEFPMAFRACLLTLISDGVTAKYGTPFTPLHLGGVELGHPDPSGRRVGSRYRTTWPGCCGSSRRPPPAATRWSTSIPPPRSPRRTSTT